MLIQKAYKLKLQPKPSQEKRLLEIADGCRYVWNYYLAQKLDIYMLGGKSPNYFQCAKDLTHLKKLEENSWLNGFSQPLQQTLRDQEVAYKNFFRKTARFPKFKCKRDSWRSFRHPIAKLKGNKVILEKGVAIRAGGTLPPMNSKLCSMTFSRDAVGTWWCSILTEQNIEPKKKTGESIGIDLGLKDLLVISDGRKIENIHPRKKVQKRLALLQRSLSRTKPASKARSRKRLDVARLHRKIGSIRSNYLHHVSKKIADENQAVIFMEDLAVKNMQRNHCLAGSISDVAWSEFVRQLEYKQRWSGGELVKIDRFFPSSKMCSNCHHVLDRLPLNVREWTCPKCKTVHDRDVNAAKNILQAGCQLGVEGTDGICGIRPMKRVTGLKKRGNLKKMLSTAKTGV